MRRRTGPELRGVPAARSRCRVKRLLASLVVVAACGGHPQGEQAQPTGLVAADAGSVPPGVDVMAPSARAWIRYQEVSNYPCSSAVRVKIDVAGEVATVTERAYDCTGEISPAYQRARTRQP